MWHPSTGLHAYSHTQTLPRALGAHKNTDIIMKKILASETIRKRSAADIEISEF